MGIHPSINRQQGDSFLDYYYRQIVVLHVPKQKKTTDGEVLRIILNPQISAR